MDLVYRAGTAVGVAHTGFDGLRLLLGTPDAVFVGAVEAACLVDVGRAPCGRLVRRLAADRHKACAYRRVGECDHQVGVSGVLAVRGLPVRLAELVPAGHAVLIRDDDAVGLPSVLV